MKYRELTPNEIEAYNVGYKNGSRQAVIKVIEFESLEEKKLYRQGYNAGCQDRKRHNVSTYEIKSNVNNVSNINSYDSAIAITNTIANTNVVQDNNSSISTTRAKEENKARVHNALEIFGNAFKGTDAIVGIFDRPDGTKREGIQIKNPHLMAFVKSRFDKSTLEKVSDWAIDHNQRGHTYNASALLKLLCKFQSNIEPSINYNSVQAEYISFEPKKKGGTK